MKKVIAISLLMVFIYSNLVYSQNLKDNIIKDTTNQYIKTFEKVDTTKTVDISSFEELKQAILVQNSTINLTKDIVFTEDLDIKSKNIIIKGNGKKIDLNKTYKFTVKSNNITLDNIEFINYLSTGLTVYRASDITLSNLTLIGNDISLSKDKRSKVGIDIYKSTVKLYNITTKNHLYRAIQVRGESTVDILSKNTHINDTIHLQTIKDIKKNESDNIVNDKNGFYLKGESTVSEDKETVNYFSKTDIEVSTAEKLIKNITSSGNVLNIKNNITINEEDLKLLGDNTELVISNNIVINGNDKIIDLNKLATVTLKGNDIKVNNLNIKNSKDIGLNIYNSKNIYLNDVSVENSTRYGIFVNGSIVKLENCSTINNNIGIMITRSRTLKSSSNQDSNVEIIPPIKQKEANINVSVTNLEMIDGYFQNNKFKAPKGIFNEVINEPEYKKLSDYYLDLFKIQGKDRDKKYKEQTINYMIYQTIINAKTNTEVKNQDGSYVRLRGDGIVDETLNLEKLIKYAALNSKEIYFPKGTYKITRDIDLSTIDFPALCNFTLSGDKNGLTIFDGSSSNEKMLKLKNEEYKTVMNYININNIVFNNMALSFNGPNKKSISLNNNAFINGEYTREKNASGDITKVTMIPYIEVKNSSYSIEKNIFLRGTNYVGRGISTYRTKNSTIKDNFFGRLEGIGDASHMLPSDVINKLNLINNKSKSTLKDSLNVDGSQGNFFTCINNERYDENVSITNNYFNLNKTRNINSDFKTDVLISGINVAKEGQRRDHIIYSKGYNGLNIYGNYFEGMENGAAGGIKIRNGKNAYIGSNHLKDVPILTYIYGDLTREECLLYNTTIYNNLLHNVTNFGKEGTGIIYYQSYKNGDTLEFKSKDVVTETWTNAYADVKNFLLYDNKFMTDDKDEITISIRAEIPYKNNEFLAYENKYVDKDILVNYRPGNIKLPESTESTILTKANDGYKKYKDVNIPLTPANVDYKYINQELSKASIFLEELEKNNISMQYPTNISNELKDLILDTTKLVKSKSLNQWDTNERITLIQETLEKLKANKLPMIYGIDDITIQVGDKFNPLNGVSAKDRDGNDLTDKIIISGKVDTTKPGKYTITYQLTDKYNNTTKHIRTITVKDKDNNNSSNNNDNKGKQNNKLNYFENIKTGDNILTFIILGILSLLAIIFINRKKK